jgi:hypothetical protein
MELPKSLFLHLLVLFLLHAEGEGTIVSQYFPALVIPLPSIRLRGMELPNHWSVLSILPAEGDGIVPSLLLHLLVLFLLPVEGDGIVQVPCSTGLVSPLYFSC